MALIKCVDCGKSFSTSASVCPNCGCPIEHSVEEQKKNKDLRDQQLSTLKRMKKLREELAELVAKNVMLELKIKQEAYIEKPDQGKNLKEIEKKKSDSLKKVKKPISGGKAFLIAFAIYIISAMCLGMGIGIYRAINPNFLVGGNSFANTMTMFCYVVFLVCLVVGIALPIITKKRYKKAVDAIDDKYAQPLKEAKQKDDDLQLKYEKELKEAEDRARNKYQPEIDANKEKMKPITAEQAKISILAEENEKHLDDIIRIIESGDADNIEEALYEIEEERRDLERQEAEARRQEAEARAKMPGTVTVKTTEGGRGKNADVYVDGSHYGVISYVTGTTSFQLSPGPHNVNVVIKSGSYLFRSNIESFNLKGGESVTLNFNLYGTSIICLRR